MDTQNRQTCKGILCVSPLSPYKMASLGFWTLPFCSLVESLRRFVALLRFPSSHAPVFLGRHLNGVGPTPPPAATTTTARRQGPPVSRRARGTWTATLEYVQKTLHLGVFFLATQDGRSEYARDGSSGSLVLPYASCPATPRRSRFEPQQPDLLAPR